MRWPRRNTSETSLFRNTSPQVSEIAHNKEHCLLILYVCTRVGHLKRALSTLYINGSDSSHGLATGYFCSPDKYPSGHVSIN